MTGKSRVEKGNDEKVDFSDIVSSRSRNEPHLDSFSSRRPNAEGATASRISGENLDLTSQL